jgi:hypothetical protein
MRLPCQTQPVERRASSSASEQADLITPSYYRKCYGSFCIIYVDGVQIITPGGGPHTLL